MHRFRVAHWGGFALALLTGFACNGPNEPFPAQALAISAPRPYRLWWEVTERCSELRGDFTSIRWYVVPNAAAINVSGRTYQGYWWSSSNRIVLAEQVLLKAQLVRHEMLHALAGSAHPREYFVDRCGGVVTCERDCAAEVGNDTPPSHDALQVSASALDVTVRIDPAAPSAKVDSGWVVITVSVRNPHPYPVWARLAPVATGETAAATFGFIVDCDAGCPGASEYAFVEADRLGFAGGQTRQLAFDHQLHPGAYFVKGFFNVDTTARAWLTVSP